MKAKFGNPPRTGEDNLTDKQRLYVKSYLQHLCGSRAAREAGYSAVQVGGGDASKYLQRDPHVRAAINEGLAEREQAVKDKAVKALEHTFAQATADASDLFDENDRLIPIRKLPQKLRRAIASMEIETRYDGHGEEAERYTVTKIKLHDKRASQELLVRFAGKLKDRLELDATMNYAEMVLAAQRKREDEPEAEPAKEPEPEE